MKKTRFISASAILFFFVLSCTSVPRGAIDDNGAKLAEDVGRVSARIDSLTDSLTESVERSRNIEEQFELINRFVQDVIDENERLRGIIDDYRNKTKGGGISEREANNNTNSDSVVSGID